jgi:hypothetical protein
VPDVADPPGPGILSRLLASVLLVALLAVAVTGLVDRPAQRYTESALARAMVTFGVARTLNGVISVVQETEVSIQPAGVGVALMPGQLLDPLNDLIERFSWVMLASAVSLGMQSTLMRMSAWWAADAALAVGVLVILFQLWGPRRGGRLAAVLQRAAALVLFLRFAIPTLLLATSFLSATFLQDDQVAATDQLAATAEAVSALAQEVEEQARPPAPERSVIERLGDYVGERLTALDLDERIERMREVAGRAAGNVVRLTASFLLETVVLPLALLWLLWQLLRWAFLTPARR